MSKGRRRGWSQEGIDAFTRGFLSDVYRHQVAGSVRRQQADVGDVDLVTTEPLSEIRERLERKGALVSGGDQVLTAHWKGTRFNVVHAKPQTFGATLMYATGPRGANIRNRTIAKARGWKLNQHGLWDSRGRLVASSEKAIYERLGKSWRPPERRGLPRLTRNGARG